MRIFTLFAFVAAVASACEIDLTPSVVTVNQLAVPYTVEAVLNCESTGGNAQEPISAVTATMTANATALADVEAEIVILPPSVKTRSTKVNIKPSVWQKRAARRPRHVTPGSLANQDETARSSAPVVKFNVTGSSAVVTMKLYGFDQDSGASLLDGPVALEVQLTAANGGAVYSAWVSVVPDFPYGVNWFELAEYEASGAYAPSLNADTAPVMLACGPFGGPRSVAMGQVQIKSSAVNTPDDVELDVPRVTVFNRTAGTVETIDDPLGAGKNKLPEGFTMTFPPQPATLLLFSMKSSDGLADTSDVVVTIETVILGDQVRYATAFTAVERLGSTCPPVHNCTVENSTAIDVALTPSETVNVDITLQCPPGVGVLQKTVNFLGSTHGYVYNLQGTSVAATAGLFIGTSPSSMQLQIMDSTGAFYYRNVNIRGIWPTGNFPNQGTIIDQGGPKGYQRVYQAFEFADPGAAAGDTGNLTTRKAITYQPGSIENDETRLIVKNVIFRRTDTTNNFFTISGTTFGPDTSAEIAKAGISWVDVKPSGRGDIMVTVDRSKLNAYKAPTTTGSLVTVDAVAVHFAIVSNIMKYDPLSDRYVGFLAKVPASPSASSSPSPSKSPQAGGGGGGMAPWGVALAVIGSFAGVALIGFAIFKFRGGKSKRDPFGDTVPHGSSYGALDA